MKGHTYSKKRKSAGQILPSKRADACANLVLPFASNSKSRSTTSAKNLSRKLKRIFPRGSKLSLRMTELGGWK